jgi:hypothetical protein
MTKEENDREYAAATTAERVINRGDVPPSTDRAESLWDKTVKPEPSTDAGIRRSEATRAVEIAERHDAVSGEQRTTATTADEVRLFRDEDTSELSRRWSDIQASFVDEPRRAVELADTLVEETMQRLAQMFAGARESLERQWDRGENVTTEDLRLTLQRYRSFFDRLLSV